MDSKYKQAKIDFQRSAPQLPESDIDIAVKNAIWARGDAEAERQRQAKWEKQLQRLRK